MSKWNILVKEVDFRLLTRQVVYSHFEFFTDSQPLFTLVNEAPHMARDAATFAGIDKPAQPGVDDLLF
jgi:hypothetical protein